MERMNERGLLGTELGVKQSDSSLKEGPAISLLNTFWVKESETEGAGMMFCVGWDALSIRGDSFALTTCTEVPQNKGLTMILIKFWVKRN